VEKFVETTRSNQDLITNDENQSGASKKTFITFLPLTFGAGLLLTLDQWTKNLVIENIPFLGTWLPENLFHLEPYFRIVHWRNSGAAFGLFSTGNNVFLILAVIASIFIFAFYPLIDKEDWPLRVAMVLQLGGALGNLIDRIRFGYVIDFISVRNFPVFNIADSCISLGVVILLLGVIYQEINLKKSQPSTEGLTVSDQTRKEEA
jgi:signal peptidase II